MTDVLGRVLRGDCKLPSPLSSTDVVVSLQASCSHLAGGWTLPWGPARTQLVLTVPLPYVFALAVQSKSRYVCPLRDLVRPGDPAGKVTSGQATPSPANNRT